MKIREVIEKINDIKSTQKLLNDAMKQEKNDSITISCVLAEDIDEKLDDLIEMWGMRDIK